jgi:ABC-type phosphate transport system substrate-binding protein
MWKKILILTLVLSLKISGALAQSGDLAVIVNKNSPLNNVTSEELAKILRGEKAKDANGVRFVLTTREAGSPERAAALAQIYKMGEDDYSKYFLQATFTGQVQAAPRALSGAAVAKQFVSVTPGAISYVRSSDADDSVKILKVDGKSPGEAGYPVTIK